MTGHQKMALQATEDRETEMIDVEGYSSQDEASMEMYSGSPTPGTPSTPGTPGRQKKAEDCLPVKVKVTKMMLISAPDSDRDVFSI